LSAGTRTWSARWTGSRFPTARSRTLRARGTARWGGRASARRRASGRASRWREGKSDASEESKNLTWFALADHTHKRQRTLHKDRKGQGRGPVPFYPSHSREVSVFIYLIFCNGLRLRFRAFLLFGPRCGEEMPCPWVVRLAARRAYSDLGYKRSKMPEKANKKNDV